MSVQRRAAAFDGQFVAVGPLALFPTDTGDAWLLDPADHLAARLARDGDPEPIQFEETDTSFAIGWKGNYSVDGEAFVFLDNHSTRIVAVPGYPTGRIAQLGRSENFEYVRLAFMIKWNFELARVSRLPLSRSRRLA